MADDPTSTRVVREVTGIVLMVLSGTTAFVYLVTAADLVTAAVLAGLAGLVAFGRWLASGTDETASETERDSVPLGPGPLYQDPEDPHSFIPRR